MKRIFIFIVSCIVGQASTLTSLHTGTDIVSGTSIFRDRSMLFRHSKSRELITSYKSTLQRRGQCCGKPVEDQKRNPARKQQQSILDSSQSNTIGPFQNRRTQHLPSSTTQGRTALAGRQRDQQYHVTGLTSTTNTALTTSQLPKGPSGTDSIGPSQSGYRNTRQSLLNTGVTGISTIAPTELDSVSSGSLKGLQLGSPNGHLPRPPTAKVKMRGPGFIEVDNFKGEPRTTRLHPGQRGQGTMRDPHGAQSIAYTDPGGKSRSRGKGGLVTAKVHKHGIGTAAIRIAEPTGTTEEVVDHRTYGTKTFTASSNDPVNPATIKVKAAGSIYTSLMVEDKPHS